MNGLNLATILARLNLLSDDATQDKDRFKSHARLVNHFLRCYATDDVTVKANKKI